MACCVLMAALLGGFAIIKAMLTLPPRGQGTAQDWRLTGAPSDIIRVGLAAA